MVTDEVYESAVKGRADFRQAFREARSRIAELEQQLADIQAAKFIDMTDEQVIAMMGGPDRADLVAEHGRYVAKVAIRENELNKHLTACMHALRSYQFGNGSPDLAKSVADAVERCLGKEVIDKGE